MIKKTEEEYLIYKNLVDTFTKYNDFGISKVISDMYKPLKEMQKSISVLNKFNNSFINNVNMINNNNFVKEMKKIALVSNKFNSINKLFKYSRLNDNSIKEIQKILSSHNINSISPKFNDVFKNLKGIHYYNNMSKNILFANTDALINKMKINNILDGCSEDDIEEVRNELKSDLLDIKENVIKRRLNLSNLQILIDNKIKKWASKNPVLKFIIYIIISSILLDIYNCSKKKLFEIYIKPDNKSTVIYQTNIYQTNINNITIINNEPYYYYIETKDKNGKIIKGYVSKRKYNKLKSNINDNSKGNLKK